MQGDNTAGYVKCWMNQTDVANIASNRALNRATQWQNRAVARDIHYCLLLGAAITIQQWWRDIRVQLHANN